MRADSRRGGGK
uniref:Uncharacterized protein n=1 Tax=Arundo donax TaxID=35708 RepID=A0A0A9H818_ARUDO